MSAWREDILGQGFEQLTLDLGADDEGPVVATLVRALPGPEPWWKRALNRVTGAHRPFEGVDVLYVHGWSDYFFQTELAGFWTSRGARFFALDLRKYGRSLREGQTPGYIEDLSHYDAEVNASLAEIKGSAEGERVQLVLGHSTGGLVLSGWASRHPGACDAILLNSPWLEFQLSGTVRKLLSPIIGLTAKLDGHDAAPQIDLGFYARAQRQVAETGNIEQIVEAWRPEQSLPVRAGWMKAILDAHEQVAEGNVTVEEPVCVLLSKRWIAPTKWSDELMHVDSVLNVNAVSHAALKLGSNITINWIEGALHDVFLSAATPRRQAYETVEAWVTGFLAAKDLVRDQPAPENK